MGYDAAFNLDPIKLNIPLQDPVRVQTNIRAYFAIKPEATTTNLESTKSESILYIRRPFIFVLEETKSNSIVFVGLVTEGNKKKTFLNGHMKCKPFQLNESI